jgi:hypothetical protein
MMEAVRTFETSVNVNVTTRCCIPEDSKLITLMIEALRTSEMSVNFNVNTRR